MRWTVLFLVFLFGCSTPTPIVVEPKPCIEKQDLDILMSCNIPPDLKGPLTPLDMINRSAELKANLKKCADRTERLKKILEKCR